MTTPLPAHQARACRRSPDRLRRGPCGHRPPM